MGSCPEFFGVHQGPLTSFADCPRGRDRASWPEVTFHMGAVAMCPCYGLCGRVCAGVGVSGTTHPGHPWGRVPCAPSPEWLSGIPPGVRQHRPLPSSPCPFLLPRAEAIGTCSSHGTADVGDVPCLPGGDTRDRWCGNAGRNYRGWRQGGRAWSGGRAGSVSPCPKALSLPWPALSMCRCPQMNARLCGIQLAPKHPNNDRSRCQDCWPRAASSAARMPAGARRLFIPGGTGLPRGDRPTCGSGIAALYSGGSAGLGLSTATGVRRGDGAVSPHGARPLMPWGFASPRGAPTAARTLDLGILRFRSARSGFAAAVELVHQCATYDSQLQSPG